MAKMTVHFIDGTQQRFNDNRGEPSYTPLVGFLEVTDEDGGKMLIPAAQVKRVDVAPPPRRL